MIKRGCFEATNMMRPLLACLSLWLSVAAASGQALGETSSSETFQLLEAENADTISFNEKVAFMSPTGEEITPSIGTYRVEPLGQSALRLVPIDKKEVFVIKAQATKHNEDIGSPMALRVVDEQDLIHVVLLLPKKTGLEAIGSSSRGRTRSAPELLTSVQIHDALLERKAVAGAPHIPTSSQRP